MIVRIPLEDVLHGAERTNNLHTTGGFVQYRRELRELRERGIEPDRAFFEQHDVFDA